MLRTILDASRVLEAQQDEVAQGQGEEAGGYVVEHDAGAGGEALELADRRRLGDVEEAEEEQGKQGVGPVGGEADEGDELAGDLVDDDVAGVFSERFAGDESGGGGGGGWLVGGAF